ncbi:MAG TPA: BREX-2 system phosphatase PglZ [Streptosporangiaceae bacterium]|nr:BREX-2 system phosphatase PglZ [Streptosporangiaceae bacterium]
MTQTATRATLPVLRALLDEARRKHYKSGVLGVRARPEWAGAPTFTHGEVAVRVVPCVSALAVREALLERVRDQWLVVLTDRPDEDLGAGVLSHLLWSRLRTPDPWEAVRHRFAATGVDPALTATPNDREIAIGLLVAAPPPGWPPAPGGVLTRDHALGAVAAAHLGLADPVIDAASVLTWTGDPAGAARIADLRALAGNTLADAVLDWAAGRAGAAGQHVLHLLRAGEGRDAVPLGLVAGLLAEARDSAAGETAQLAREALIRLEPRLGGTAPATAILRSWAGESSAVVSEMLRDPVNQANAAALLARADELVITAHGAAVADRSDLLPTGLTGRLAALADALRAASARAAAGQSADLDAPQIPPGALTDVEQAWARVAAHRLAGADDRTPAFHAAVRLARWLAADSVADGTSLRHLLGRHPDNDAWADSAVNDAAPGVSDPDLAAGLAAVLAAVRIRRAPHDRAFAAALAAHTDSDPDAVSGNHNGVWPVEDLLPDVVLPLTRSTPVLLLVLDGMSAAVCAEVMSSVLSRTGDGWAEALLSGQTRRAAALAALPTVTEVSRASLLCGQLRTGGRDVEERGYQALARAHGLVRAALFHKKPLDSSRLGHALADDVAAAIGDVTGYPLVTCVLNTIDDALDRSDPVGTEWGAEAVKHLVPLLDRARHAGRAVVLTADHGFVAERRQGVQRTCAAISSGRSRAAVEPAADDEVLVTGRRVLLHEGRAVLAVDERLRYGPLKAGYHGGAAPAEAVVPVAVVVPGAVPEDVDLRLAPPQEPAWWIDPVDPLAPETAPSPAVISAARREPAAALRARRKDEPPTLFDVSEAAPVPPGTAPSADPVAAAVLKAPAYTAQKKIAGRVSTTDGQIRGLLDALLAAPGHRLPPTLAATALDVSPVTLRGAVLHAQRLLNVEGYPVLRVDADGSTVILDEALLREQFGISS